MDISPAIGAARHFLDVVWGVHVPNEEELLEALDRLLVAYHDTPDASPSDTDLEASRVSGPLLYNEVLYRFPAFGLYPVSNPAAPPDTAAMMGDAIDDLADLTLDMREVIWLADHVGRDDANWSYRLHFSHWGRHARELSLYLHSRQFG